MKNKILNNLGLKILAVIFAIMLWLVVMNISDYTVTVHIDDIPVVKENGEVLESLDQLYDVVSGDTVDIIVKGRRSVVDSLSAKDFVATADLSTMSITNTVQITIEPKEKIYEEDLSITCVDNIMKLSLEEKVSVQLPVTVDIKGTVADNYAVGDTVATPNIITIEGPKSTVSKVVKAATLVDVSGKNESFEAASDIVLYDAYGEAVKNDRITLSQEQIDITVNVYPVKQVTVEVNVVGMAKDGYAIGEVLYQPQVVRVAGATENLMGFNKIVVDDISVSGLEKDYQTSIDLTPYLPEGVTLAQETDVVVVNVTIERLKSKTISLKENDIKLNGKSEDYDYELEISSDFGIVVTGTEEQLEDIDATSLAARIYCMSLSAGENDAGKALTYETVEEVEYELKGSATINVKKRK